MPDNPAKVLKKRAFDEFQRQTSFDQTERNGQAENHSAKQRHEAERNEKELWSVSYTLPYALTKFWFCVCEFTIISYG